MSILLLLVLLTQGATTTDQEVLTFDLQSLPSGTTQTIKIPGEKAFAVFVVGRAHGARYKLILGIPDGARAESFQEIDRDPPRRLGGSGCATIAEKVRSFLDATDESLAAQGKSELLAALAEPGCEEASRVRAWLEQADRVSVMSSDGLELGDSSPFTLQRLASGTETPARSWHFLFVPGEPTRTWTHANERSWLVWEVATRISRLAARVPRSKAPTRLKAEPVEGSGGGIGVGPASAAPSRAETVAVVRGSPFSALPYQALAAGWLGKRPATTPGDGSAQRFIADLTDPRTAVLVREDARLFDALEKAPSDPVALEQAGLLLATLAWRESAGLFSELRPTLCEITARLAVARALRGDAGLGPAGALAEAIVLALTGRERDALEAVEKWPAPTAGEQAWLNAIRLRVTEDWRSLARPVVATLLERIEYLRAVSSRRGIEQGLDFLGRRNLEATSDWHRIVLGQLPTSVRGGNLFADSALEQELGELEEVFRAVFREGRTRPETRPAVISALRSDDVTGPGASTVGWPVWVALHRRHIAHVGLGVDRYLDSLGAKPEASATSWERLESAIGGTLDYSLAGIRRGRLALGSEPGQSGCRRWVTLGRIQPESVSPATWDFVSATCRIGEGNLAGHMRWFDPGLPPGTALDFQRRQRFLSSAVSAEATRKLAPYGSSVAQWAFRSAFPTPGDRTLARFDAFYAEVLDYDVHVMRERANLLKESPAAYVEQSRRIAELDPDAWVTLGNYLVGQELEDQAAAAFHRAIEEASGRVALSSQLDWLVNYHEDAGRSAEALAVARVAADVYSYPGLETMARLMERRQLWDEAKRYHDLQVERYMNRNGLDGFLWRYRHKVGDDRFGAHLMMPTSRNIAFGPIEPARLADFAGVPRSGVHVEASAPALSKKGLEKGDVIVAMHGYRIRNGLDLAFIQGLGESAEAPVIVWSGSRRVYSELKLPLSRPHPALAWRSY